MKGRRDSTWSHLLKTKHMSCTCHFCVSPCVQWNPSATTVVLPIAVRFMDDALGLSIWAWLVNFDGVHFWIKCVANVGGVNVPYTFKNAFEASNAVSGYVHFPSSSQPLTEVEKMWHFKTHVGFRSIRSLRSTNVSIIVSPANTTNLDFQTMNCRGNASSYLSVNESTNPVHSATSVIPSQFNKRKRASASSKRKQQQAPPPMSPNAKVIQFPPYDVDTLGGNEYVKTIAMDAVMPWSTETITELLTNGATIPLVKVSNILQGRYGFVECSFTLPNGNVVHNVWIHINLLAYRYSNRIKHL